MKRKDKLKSSVFLCYVKKKGIIFDLNKLKLSAIIFKSLIMNK